MWPLLRSNRSAARRAQRATKSRKLFFDVLEDRRLLAVSIASIVDLGTLGRNGWSDAYGINDKGQVVGESGVSEESHAFLYDGTMHDLGTLGGSYSHANAINDKGQVVGGADISDEQSHAFFYDGAMHDLGTLGGSYSWAGGINDTGQVVGTADTMDDVSHAFLYDGAMHDLGTFGGDNSWANGINDAGQVVGEAETTDYDSHAFLYDGAMHDLGTLGGSYSAARGINGKGQVVGGADVSDEESHAFLYDGAMHDLGTLGGSYSAAWGINGKGQVVGESGELSDFTYSDSRAFLYDGANMIDLNKLLPARSGWVLESALGINNEGQICGYGRHNGKSHAFLLKTSSEVIPTSLALNANGSLDFKYSVNANSLSKATSIGVYWGLGADATPDLEHPIATYSLKAGTKRTSKLIHVSEAKLVTAPADATSILVIADPTGVLGPHQDDETCSLKYSPDVPLTVAQLVKSMPGLPQADAQRYIDPLNAAMANLGIRTLEQKAMFLGQVAAQSNNLKTWTEKFSGNANSYFINKYWVNKGQWTGLGSSVPTKDGITLKVPYAKGVATKTYQLHWAQGATLADGATLYNETSFTFAKNVYTAKFAGAVPPASTTYLLVVDPDTNNVVLAIHNKLGNWSPQDAANFCGRGPIQLTGRYNYQKFADYSSTPDLMNSPAMLADKTTAATLGMQSAAWFWEVLNGQQLNEKVDSYAYKTSTDLNTAITKAITEGTSGLAQRLAGYRRARSALLIAPVTQSAGSAVTDAAILMLSDER